MKRTSTFFPLFLDLSERNVVFIGGGRIATRRVKAMAPFAPHLTVIAPCVSDDIRLLADEGAVVWRCEAWTAQAADELLSEADIVLVCTDNHELNNDIRAQCSERGILVNICSDHEQCDFYFPGIVQRGNVVVAVNASGRDHVRARELRERIQEMLEEDDG